MSKKIDTSSPVAPQADGEPRDTSRQIWLAGLGAFAKAQQQGGKVFEALVQEGLQLQRKTQEAAQAQMAEASQKFSALASGLGERAGQPWDRLEGIFEQRVARALQRLNVASAAEVQSLRERIGLLEAQVRPAGSPETRPTGKSRPAASAATRTPRRGEAAD